MRNRRRAKLGDYLVQCDRTGGTFYASECVQEWDGKFVARKYYRPRQPQDLLTGVPEAAVPRILRPLRDTFAQPANVDFSNDFSNDFNSKYFRL